METNHYHHQVNEEQISQEIFQNSLLPNPSIKDLPQSLNSFFISNDNAKQSFTTSTYRNKGYFKYVYFSLLLLNINFLDDFYFAGGQANNFFQNGNCHICKRKKVVYGCFKDYGATTCQ